MRVWGVRVLHKVNAAAAAVHGSQRSERELGSPWSLLLAVSTRSRADTNLSSSFSCCSAA